jgi:hypothetical protein
MIARLVRWLSWMTRRRKTCPSDVKPASVVLTHAPPVRPTGDCHATSPLPQVLALPTQEPRATSESIDETASNLEGEFLLAGISPKVAPGPKSFAAPQRPAREPFPPGPCPAVLAQEVVKSGQNSHDFMQSMPKEKIDNLMLRMSVRSRQALLHYTPSGSPGAAWPPTCERALLRLSPTETCCSPKCRH